MASIASVLFFPILSSAKVFFWALKFELEKWYRNHSLSCVLIRSLFDDNFPLFNPCCKVALKWMYSKKVKSTGFAGDLTG